MGVMGVDPWGVLEALSQAIVVVDEGGRVQYRNRAAANTRPIPLRAPS